MHFNVTIVDEIKSTKSPMHSIVIGLGVQMPQRSTN